jgi:hypothetical protein
MNKEMCKIAPVGPARVKTHAWRALVAGAGRVLGGTLCRGRAPEALRRELLPVQVPRGQLHH